MLELAKTKIVVIHDDIIEDNPIMVMLRHKYGIDNVLLFQHSKEGQDYVLNNLGQRMVVLLDKNFKGAKEMSGIQVFQNIRLETSLVYIILITANHFSEITSDDLKLLINNDLFKIESFTTDYTIILNLVEDAVQEMNLRLDCVVEEWILRHSSKDQEKPLMRFKDGKTYSMREVLKSIRHKGAIGIEFQEMVVNLAINMVARQKISS